LQLSWLALRDHAQPASEASSKKINYIYYLEKLFMIYKLIIIGSGPAGYTAGIYAGRAELKPLVFSGLSPGGQLMNTSLVENWPGGMRPLKSAKDSTNDIHHLIIDKSDKTMKMVVGIGGPELMMNMRQQAEKFGAEIIDKNVSKVELTGGIKRVFVGNEMFEAKTVIIATGAEAIMLGVPGEKKFMGRGVAVCAVCDAPFYKDKTAFVIGGGNAAVIDAIALTKFAKKVYLVHRRDELRASKIMIKRVIDNSKIEILWNTELKEIRGEEKVEEVVLQTSQGSELALRDRPDIKSGLEVRNHDMKADGVFLAVGHRPVTEFFKGQLELDKKGYIVTKGGRVGVTQTSIDGVFAAGDVVDYNYQQAITAAATGCQAALDAEKYLSNKKGDYEKYKN